MKANFARAILLSLTALLIVTPGAFAQRQLGKKKGPTSKIYLAEAIGDSEIQTGEKIYAARQATAFDAPGTVIETKAGAHNAFVFSNGVGMSLGENSRVEILHFEQAPFSAKGNAGADSTEEPSNSQSDIYLSRGTVGISTSQLASGSSMSCSTDLASINIRGGNISIQSSADETIIDLLNGAATVFSRDRDGKSYLLQPGERIIIRRGAVGQPLLVTIGQIPPAVLPHLIEFIALASNARKTVTFEVIEKKADEGLDAPRANTGTPTVAPADDEAEGTQEIVAKPTVPSEPPINIVISPDRLPGT